MVKRRVDRGQAILLAVVGLLILAIGMYTSYNLSRAVYEKIQLQNAADAAAYSVATLEARTFNFISFANRAQVANYVQMLESQSLLSNATFIEGMTGWMGDVLISVGFWLRILAPEAGDLLVQAGRVLEANHDAWSAVIENAMEPWQPRFVQLKTAENSALYAVSLMLALSTAMQVADGAHHIAMDNDPDAQRTPISLALNGLNFASYISAFDAASLDMCSSDADSQRAKRLMAELVHASRRGTAPQTSEDFVVSRNALSTLENLLGSLASFEQAGSERQRRRARNAVQPFFDLLETLKLNFVGTGKMLVQGDRTFPDPDDTGEQRPDRSALVRADTLLAKDTITRRGSLSIFPGWQTDDGVFASVVSTPEAGLHCRYVKPADYGSPMPMRILVTLPRGNDFKCEREDNHIWRGLFGKGGIQPFLTFNPGLEPAVPLLSERTSFKQPSVWVALTKRPEAMALAGDRDLDFEIEQGRSGTAALDARIGEGGIMNTGLGAGMHAWARAQVYYHRPGAWQEPPNFFNPFWGARLAPKNVLIKGVGADLGLPSLFSQLVADNVMMH
jgi:hypothetical protein